MISRSINSEDRTYAITAETIEGWRRQFEIDNTAMPEEYKRWASSGGKNRLHEGRQASGLEGEYAKIHDHVANYQSTQQNHERRIQSFYR